MSMEMFVKGTKTRSTEAMASLKFQAGCVIQDFMLFKLAHTSSEMSVNAFMLTKNQES